MTTEYQFWLIAITLDKQAGNSLATIIGESPEDDRTFDLGTPLRRTADGAPAWLATSSMTQTALAYCEEFNGAGPYPLLTAHGLTAEQIAGLKSIMTLEYGPRATHERLAGDVLTAHGYEIIPQD